MLTCIHSHFEGIGRGGTRRCPAPSTFEWRSEMNEGDLLNEIEVEGTRARSDIVRMERRRSRSPVRVASAKSDRTTLAVPCSLLPGAAAWIATNPPEASP